MANIPNPRRIPWNDPYRDVIDQEAIWITLNSTIQIMGLIDTGMDVDNSVDCLQTAVDVVLSRYPVLSLEVVPNDIGTYSYRPRKEPLKLDLVHDYYTSPPVSTMSEYDSVLAYPVPGYQAPKDGVSRLFHVKLVRFEVPDDPDPDFLTAIDGHTHALVVSLHHILGDGNSTVMLLKMLAELWISEGLDACRKPRQAGTVWSNMYCPGGVPTITLPTEGSLAATLSGTKLDSNPIEERTPSCVTAAVPVSHLSQARVYDYPLTDTLGGVLLAVTGAQILNERKRDGDETTDMTLRMWLPSDVQPILRAQRPDLPDIGGLVSNAASGGRGQIHATPTTTVEAVCQAVNAGREREKATSTPTFWAVTKALLSKGVQTSVSPDINSQTCVFSNLGRVDLPYPLAEITGCVFSRGVGKYVVGAMNTRGSSTVSLTFSYSQPFFSRDMAIAHRDAFLKTLPWVRDNPKATLQDLALFLETL
ncbi:hypothetical protein KIPB_007016 [Kipferlia bialata]|uniref:Uncharacterized protein n=1 Tax=Kipferlia bialata TaxID=797122 RepID=A0A9K3CY42_9EUKA|nr:hypothetical protein KIPB_001541 [Kipferlia bialata]GIQ85366.1 hypothetical protein KIPB_007016 [Kipferlia bialata]|eukprot:g1541.t1